MGGRGGARTKRVSNNGDLQPVTKDTVISRVPSGKVRMKFPPAGTRHSLAFNDLPVNFDQPCFARG